jgi:hypothetical protein
LVWLPLVNQYGVQMLVLSDPVLNSSSKTSLVGAFKLAGTSGIAPLLDAVGVVDVVVDVVVDFDPDGVVVVVVVVVVIVVVVGSVTGSPFFRGCTVTVVTVATVVDAATLLVTVVTVVDGVGWVTTVLGGPPTLKGCTADRPCFRGATLGVFGIAMPEFRGLPAAAAPVFSG